jgi:osmotically-inducible protein OsmY
MITSRTMERTSSHELARAAQKRLRHTSYPRIRELTCECDDRGVLYLRGCLPSYYQKQLAQEAVSDLPGIRKIVNQAEVVDTAFTIPALA